MVDQVYQIRVLQSREEFCFNRVGSIFGWSWEVGLDGVKLMIFTGKVDIGLSSIS